MITDKGSFQFSYSAEETSAVCVCKKHIEQIKFEDNLCNYLAVEQGCCLGLPSCLVGPIGFPVCVR